MMTVEQDIYTRVTYKIIADLEKGNLTWIKPWESKDLVGCVALPLRREGQPYQDINVLYPTITYKGF